MTGPIIAQSKIPIVVGGKADSVDQQQEITDFGQLDQMIQYQQLKTSSEEKRTSH